jgi:hypothetical protein
MNEDRLITDGERALVFELVKTMKQIVGGDMPLAEMEKRLDAFTMLALEIEQMLLEGTLAGDDGLCLAMLELVREYAGGRLTTVGL